MCLHKLALTFLHAHRFDSPPTVLGRGTFGEVYLAEYRGARARACFCPRACVLSVAQCLYLCFEPVPVFARVPAPVPVPVSLLVTVGDNAWVSETVLFLVPVAT